MFRLCFHYRRFRFPLIRGLSLQFFPFLFRLCSGLIAAVMVLGLLFDEETVKEKRILFFFLVQEKSGVLDCMRLSSDDCTELLEMIGEVLQEVIEMK